MEGLIQKKDCSEPKKLLDGILASTSEPLFQRRIEFHHARKPFTPYVGSNFHLETLNPISDSPKPTVNMSTPTFSGQKLESNHFYELSLDSDLTLKIRFQRIGAGLANLGNTCFLNSVLQCLTYTEPLAAYLQSGKHKSSCHVSGFCAMCAIQSHVMNALQSSGKILSPSHLVKNLRCISRNFRNSRQEDAHEYMVNLMESMHKCCLPCGVPSESPVAYEKSLVHKIFGGRLRSQVKCKQCSHASNTYDPFLDLSLEIAKADTLQKALGNFTAVEHLDGGERKYRCESCKEKVVALKQLTIHKAPNVLTIHLKRFGSGLGEKIVKNVRFAPNIDLKPYVSGPYEGDLKYTLYGVLVHAGWSTHSGHYYCFVRASTGVWHVLDDNKVSPVSEKVVMEQKAYMLFYVVDRKNSASKKPVDIHGIKKIPVALPGPRETIRDDKMEIKSSTESVVEASLKDFMTKEPSVLQTAGQVMAERFQGSAQTVENGTGTATSQSLTDTIRTENGEGFEPELPVGKLLKENGITCQFDVIKSGKSLSMPTSKGVEERDLEGKRNGSVEASEKSVVGERGSKLEKSWSMELLNQPSTSNGCAHEVHDKHGDHKVINKHCDHEVLGKHVQFRKRPVKPYKLAKCHLLRNIIIGRKWLFFTALRLQIRCKRRRGKRVGLDMRSFTHRDLSDNVSSEEASTSKTSDSKLSDGSSINIKKRDLGKRQKKSDAAIATNIMENGLSKGNCVRREQDGRNERGSMQNCLVGLLTRGLQEASVARWEGIEMEPSDIDRSKDANPKSIGYLLDEWDEEYDLGKRKKIRKTEEFSVGYNPFQEYMTQKSESEKMMDWTRSGNQQQRKKR